jgi:hypothetical protein
VLPDTEQVAPGMPGATCGLIAGDAVTGWFKVKAGRAALSSSCPGRFPG